MIRIQNHKRLKIVSPWAFPIPKQRRMPDELIHKFLVPLKRGYGVFLMPSASESLKIFY